MIQGCLVLLFLDFSWAHKPGESILASGVTQGVYPGAVGAVGSSDGVSYTTNVGNFEYDLGSKFMSVDTIFDLASLTKVLATTTAVALLYQEGLIELDTHVTDILGAEFGEANNGTKAGVTIRHCLTHTAGFPPDPDPWYWDPSFGCPEGSPQNPPAAPLAEDFRCVALVYESVLEQTLDSLPGQTFLYSDLSFITLQFAVGKLVYDRRIVEPGDLRPECSDTDDANGGESTRFTCYFEAFVRTRVLAPVMPNASFLPDQALWAHTAPTLNDTVYTGGLPLQGQVSDGDAFAMGGIAGHAGLFSALDDVTAFAHALLLAVMEGDPTSPSPPSSSTFPLNATTARVFTTVANASQSSRALGWDTNLNNVSDFGFDGVCGGRASMKTFLHIGYSGTCICIDPEGNPVDSESQDDGTNERTAGFFSVVLTNRIYGCQGQLCPSGSEEAVKTIYHDFNSAANTGPSSIRDSQQPFESVSIGSTVSFQAHSFNDLREWPQLIAKGTRFLKVDPQWAPPEFCESMTRVADPSGGCLLLNHDAVSTQRTNYNTTDDVLAFISSDASAAWTRNPDPESKVFISLCFKGCGGVLCPCDPSTETTQWLSLVDNFVAGANAAVASLGLNVEFILDGEGNPGKVKSPCLVDRWRPWNSVFITSTDPQGAFTSNDPQLGWDRLQVLNQKYVNWDSTVDGNFGKFQNSSYPYFIWEPSDQPSILEYALEYTNKGLLHEQGMRFAINIDPAQFETYAASVTGRALDEVIVADFEGATQAVTPVLSVATLDESSTVSFKYIGINVWSQDSALDFNIFGFNSSSSISSVPLGGGTLTGFNGALDALFLSTVTILADTYAVVTSSVGTLLKQGIYLVQANNTSDGTLDLSLTQTASIDLADVGASASATSVFACAGTIAASSPSDMCTVVVYAAKATEQGGAHNDDGSSCALWLSLYSWSLEEPLLPSTCLVNVTGIFGDQVPIIQPGELSVAAVAVSGSAKAVAVAATYASQGIVYGASACINLNDFTVTVNNASSCGARLAPPTQSSSPSTRAPLSLWVGARPSVAMLPGDAGEVKVFATLGQGFCANSEAHNKNAAQGLCDQVPTANSGGAYLNYAYGSWLGWTSGLLEASATGRMAGNPCSEHLASGMFGMGSSPSAAMWAETDTESNQPQIRAAVSYVGLDAASDPGGCGVATAAPGTLKLAGWPLAQSYFLSDP